VRVCTVTFSKANPVHLRSPGAHAKHPAGTDGPTVATTLRIVTLATRSQFEVSGGRGEGRAHGAASSCHTSACKGQTHSRSI
jgi:hypothetical protein